MSDTAHARRNLEQRRYFEDVDRPRLAVGETRYVREHLDRVCEIAQLLPSHRILEVGAGLGKFTIPLLDRGLRVVANDLSPLLLARLEVGAAGRAETRCCDIHEMRDRCEAPFDRIIGFFVLHHLRDLPALFVRLRSVLCPGGRLAFCEPVGLNPLYALQVALTPHMSFAGEPSLFAMRPTVILPALREAGFRRARSTSYGFFPPFLKNNRLGAAIERRLEAAPFVPFPRAFQIFSAEAPS